MPKQIELQNQSISYTVRNSRRAKHLRLAVYRDGGLVVIMPNGFREALAERFMRQKAGWIVNKLEFFKQFKGRTIIKSSRRDYLKYKGQVLRLVNERLNYFNWLYNFSWQRISVRNQKTRWGSCSQKGNLNFNYKLVFLPAEAADYIIVHELCHLGEFNHSKKFWQLVARAAPDYLDIRRELKAKGLIYY
ncbi:MAG: SprT family zinc-dependent metalloprotease [Patescibacteria group bacterium]|jgi:hypothetical protein